MKIVVMGGAGQVGANLVERLETFGHDVVPASRRTGVDVVTGQGLVQALSGADVVIDVTNSPSFEDAAAMSFFETAGARLMDAEAEAGVRHHIVLSVVGAERLHASGYFRAKLAQEQRVRAGVLPYTILRSTQFFEFLDAIARDGAVGREVRLSPARIQPIAVDDVAEALANLAHMQPVNAVVEVAGPDPFRLNEIVRSYLSATGDRRPVVPDPAALYFGTVLNDETLMAGAIPRFGHTDFEMWLRRWVRDHPLAIPNQLRSEGSPQ